MAIGRIHDASWIEDKDGFALLSVFLDGRQVMIYHESQRWLDQDIVNLPDLDRFEYDKITIKANRKTGPDQDLTLVTAVKDKRLASLVKQYKEAVWAGTFKPGPVKIPKEVTGG